VQQANRLRSIVTPQAVAQLTPRLLAAPSDPLDTLMAWHLISLNVTAVDHTAANGTDAYHEQYGPHRTSRALAIVHTAIFEVANAFAPSGSKYKSYVNQVKGSNVIAAPPADASEAAAIIEAAYGTLTSLYPGQVTNPQSVHDSAIAALGSSASTSAGQAYGVSASKAVNDLRTNDNSDLPEPRWDNGPAQNGFVPTQPVGTAGQWAIDPVSNIATALGGNWPQVTPSTLSSPSQLRSKDVQFCLSERAFHAEDKAVVEVGWIVAAISVEHQCLGDRTQLQQAMPIFVGARQARGLQREDRADLTHRSPGL
jgi:hypothetical protein